MDPSRRPGRPARPAGSFVFVPPSTLRTNPIMNLTDQLSEYVRAAFSQDSTQYGQINSLKFTNRKT